MFKTFAEVPTSIKPFYQEVTRSEPLLDEEGNQVFEPVEQESTDMYGNPVTVTVQKPVFHGVVYVELIGKTETKSMADVHRVIKLHKGNRDDVIELFLSMVNTGIEWDFHDDYLLWFQLSKDLSTALAETKAEELADPTEEDLKAHLDKISNLEQQLGSHLEAEPKEIKIVTPEHWMLINYKELRMAAYPSKEEQMILQFNDMDEGTNTWQESIRTVNKQYPRVTKD